jgi:hypothetical protein
VHELLSDLAAHLMTDAGRAQLFALGFAMVLPPHAALASAAFAQRAIFLKPGYAQAVQRHNQ